MTMPSSGPINMGGTSSPVSVAQELGLGLTTTISMNDAAVRSLAGVGGSGTSWSLSTMYGKSSIVVANLVISADTQNYVLDPSKVTGYVAGKTVVTLTINSGVYLGASSISNFGLDVASTWDAADSVTVVNNGYILGCGGAGDDYGGSGSGFPGGTALRVQWAGTKVNNVGVIGGGGGGGGRGYDTDNLKSPSYLYQYCGSGGQGYSGGAAGAQSGFISGNAGTKTAPGAGVGYAGSGGSLGANGNVGYYVVAGGSIGNSGGGAAGSCTASGTNANITWIATGTRYGSIL